MRPRLDLRGPGLFDKPQCPPHDRKHTLHEEADGLQTIVRRAPDITPRYVYSGSHLLRPINAGR